MANTRTRFSIALEDEDLKVLDSLASKQRPRLTRQFLVELAISRLIDEARMGEFDLGRWISRSEAQ